MSYFGNVPPERFSAVTKDSFNGDGSTTEFTLTNPGTTNGVEVFVENVQQEPTTAYSVSGTTLTFTAAPVSGTGNIYVVNRGTPVSTITHPPGTALQATSGTFSGTVTFNNATPVSGVDFGDLDNVTSSASDPAVTTNPASGVGTVWVNTSTGQMYVCRDATTNQNIWTNVGTGSQNVKPAYSVDYLVVAGGGAGGYNDRSGGGGAGGLKASYSTDASGGATSSQTALTFNGGTIYTITIGAGGTGGANPGGSGSDSSISGSDITTVTCLGGGGGHYFAAGVAGGCGGGGGIYSYAGGAGTSGQGFGGGTADGSGAGNNAGGGGGGGTGAVGGSSSGGGVSGAGGVGTISTIISTSQATTSSVGEVDSSTLYFGGGGGGGNFSNFGGDGGLGGGGNGGYNGTTKLGEDGAANSGGGGGGAGGPGAYGSPFDGGSGVVILRMPTSSYSGTYTGDSVDVATDGSDTILIFKSSGTYTA